MPNADKPQIPLPKLRGPDGELIDVPPEGMLGLLALGDEGLLLWRQAREAAGEASHWTITMPEESDKSVRNFHTQGVGDD